MGTTLCRVFAMIIEYDNPFYDDSNRVSVKRFSRKHPKITVIQKGEGMIVTPSKGHNNYLIKGWLVTQRVGHSKKLLRRLIDVCLNGAYTTDWQEKRARDIFFLYSNATL